MSRKRQNIPQNPQKKRLKNNPKFINARNQKSLHDEFLRTFSLESDIKVEGLTIEKIDHYDFDAMDIPTIYAAPLDDFSVSLQVDNELIKAHWQKRSFSADTVKRIRAVAHKGNIQPVCVVFFEGFGIKEAYALCHDPDGSINHCQKTVPLLFGENTDEARLLWDIAYRALCLVQNEILHKNKAVHKINEVPRKPEETDSGHSSAASKNRITKHKTVIRLSKSIVNIYTTSNERHHWTQWWIVGAHLRTTEKKLPNGKTEKIVSKIQPYLKGPGRNSEEAKSYFESYLRTSESKNINIEVH